MALPSTTGRHALPWIPPGHVNCPKAPSGKSLCNIAPCQTQTAQHQRAKSTADPVPPNDSTPTLQGDFPEPLLDKTQAGPCCQHAPTARPPLCAEPTQHKHTQTTSGREEGCALAGASGTRHEQRHVRRQEKRHWERVHHATKRWCNPAWHCLHTFRTHGSPHTRQIGHAPLCTEAQVAKHANGHA